MKKYILTLSVVASMLFLGCSDSSDTSQNSNTSSSSFSQSSSSTQSRSDATIVFGNVGIDDYIISETDNIEVTQVGATDPTIVLGVGQRYTFSVLLPTQHPIQLSDSNGEALLAMGSKDAPFESDEEVNFVDNSDGSISFTLTQNLANEAVSYRCQFHSDMVGSFDIN